jgi:hypothetical protein
LFLVRPVSGKWTWDGSAAQPAIKKKGSDDGINEKAINGRFMTQRMTGVQRCIRNRCVAVANVDSEHGWRDAIIGLAEYQELRATTAEQARKRAVTFSRKRCLGYLPQISQPREAHVERLMASASIQGQGDEYRSPPALTKPTFRIA